MKPKPKNPLIKKGIQKPRKKPRITKKTAAKSMKNTSLKSPKLGIISPEKIQIQKLNNLIQQLKKSNNSVAKSGSEPFTVTMSISKKTTRKMNKLPEKITFDI